MSRSKVLRESAERKSQEVDRLIQAPKFRDTVNELLAKKREFENQDRQPIL